MIVEGYGDRRVENICNDENYARRFFQPADAMKLKILLSRLKATRHINNFFTKPLIDMYNTETLKGTKKEEIISLRINGRDRMEIKVLVRVADGDDSIKIMEVKGHYERSKR